MEPTKQKAAWIHVPLLRALRFVLLIRTHAEEANLLETKSTQTPNKRKNETQHFWSFIKMFLSLGHLKLNLDLNAKSIFCHNFQ